MDGKQVTEDTDKARYKRRKRSKQSRYKHSKQVIKDADRAKQRRGR